MGSAQSGSRSGINYRFCGVCGSSIYFDMIWPVTGGRFFTIALGCFVEPVFQPPSTEFNTKLRHPWVQPIPGAVRLLTIRWEPMRKRLGKRPTHEAEPVR